MQSLFRFAYSLAKPTWKQAIMFHLHDAELGQMQELSNCKRNGAVVLEWSENSWMLTDCMGHLSTSDVWTLPQKSAWLFKISVKFHYYNNA